MSTCELLLKACTAGNDDRAHLATLCSIVVTHCFDKQCDMRNLGAVACYHKPIQQQKQMENQASAHCSSCLPMFWPVICNSLAASAARAATRLRMMVSKSRSSTLNSGCQALSCGQLLFLASDITNQVTKQNSRTPQCTQFGFDDVEHAMQSAVRYTAHSEPGNDTLQAFNPEHQPTGWAAKGTKNFMWRHSLNQ